MSASSIRCTSTALLVAILMSLPGCASGPPKPAKAVITVAARPDVNPDASGRPSPVVVRFYQLKSDAAFSGAEFFPLFDDDKKVLAADLIARDEYELSPGEDKTLELTVPAEVRFVGAIAAFRDIRNATWRALAPTPKKGLAKTPVHIIAEKQAVRIELGR
jgi:type VI secretion system protein VasD